MTGLTRSHFFPKQETRCHLLPEIKRPETPRLLEGGRDVQARSPKTRGVVCFLCTMISYNRDLGILHQGTPEGGVDKESVYMKNEKNLQKPPLGNGVMI